MASISQESPPESTDATLSEFLTRRFIDIGNAIKQSYKHAERKENPYKPTFGDFHYFGDPTIHNYDPEITTNGFWGYVEILPATDPKTGEWVKL